MQPSSRKVIAVTRVLLIGLSVLWVPAHSQASAAIDLVTHNVVQIRATPAQIWPHIVHSNDWKAGADLISIGGKPGGRGEQFKAVLAEEPDIILFHVENVEMILERRRTIRLNAQDGQLIGYASWEIIPQGDVTLVEYHVYSQLVLRPEPGASLTAEALEAAEADNHWSNHRRFAAELETLKRHVEDRER